MIHGLWGVTAAGIAQEGLDPQIHAENWPSYNN
jgi:hypothetical protein